MQFILLLILVGVGVLLTTTSSSSALPIATMPRRLYGFDPQRLTYPQDDEEARILGVADEFGVDPGFLAAIRLQENGRGGREFGVLSVPAPTYDEQLRVTARTVQRRLTTYATESGLSPYDTRGRLTPGFIRYFGGIWAPEGAANDPTGLNQYWVTNVTQFYDLITVVA